MKTRLRNLLWVFMALTLLLAGTTLVRAYDISFSDVPESSWFYEDVFKFQPFADGSAWLDFWDFLVSNNILPLGSLVFALYCCNKFGWGWDNFLAEANEGKGWKVKAWMKPIFRYLVPAAIIFIYIYGMVTFGWK